jgi:hypothetical protein
MCSKVARKAEKESKRRLILKARELKEGDLSQSKDYYDIEMLQ